MTSSLQFFRAAIPCFANTRCKLIAASKSFLITSFSSSPNGQYASNGIRHKAILDFMKQQYNILTNSDENYIHEVQSSGC
uniref:Uncharacterized protein n=1 Tax=Bacillus cereus VPC1401 TaxID=870739 RepID=E5AK28_BACCE|nr:hypothetical protein pLVP1401_17 [Bacillus cereus VPC1401]